MKRSIIVIFTSLTMFLLTSSVSGEPSYSPYTNQSFPANIYWGDTHLHTNLSLDAYFTGNWRLGPEDTYRFSKGETVTAHNGMKVRLRRPLDFIVIADHAEGFGVMTGLERRNPVLLKTESGRRLRLEMDKVEEIRKTDSARATKMSVKILWTGKNTEDVYATYSATPSFKKTTWEQVAALADQHNAPGRFTAFIGYEWMGIDSRKKNTSSQYHRVVVFQDGSEKAASVQPFTNLDSSDPAKLWDYLATYEKNTGGAAFAIPHNGNLSNGTMFALTDYENRPLSAAYAATRSRWEPLVETIQIKGDSETHPALSLNDEFANYETWNGWLGVEPGKVLTQEEIELKKYEYSRSALKLGLQQQTELGVNPFKFGMIGGTDAHTSLPAIDESNYWGKMTKEEPSADRMTMRMLPWAEKSQGWEHAAAGYTAIWAEENTRESLFAAMKRKEVYTSTGPRMTLRFFGGWNYRADDAFSPDLAIIGYEGGVPMGGDLTTAHGKAPKFLIRAVKDPDGANLDRVQVIKGWRSEDGELHEKVYDVALSDDRKIRLNKRSQPVGFTVDIEDASYTNTIGDPELAVVWEDPDFEEDELAFYYVRVLEIPTPRWTAYDAKYFDIPLESIPKEAPMVTQERAYSSPIWYTPSAKVNGE